jgi:hypothetical protein
VAHDAAEAGDQVALACTHGGIISSVHVASLGVARGKCGAYEGAASPRTALAAFDAACVGKESCAVVQHTDDFRAAVAAIVAAGCDSGVLTVQAEGSTTWPLLLAEALTAPPLSPSRAPAAALLPSPPTRAILRISEEENQSF